MSGRTVRRRFVEAGRRVVHYRRAGSGPPVVLIHQSPQSSAGLLPLIDRLAPYCTVFAFDTPGCGDSDPLPRRNPRMADFADALAETMDGVGLRKAAVFGTKTGACVGLEFARRYPARVRGVVLDSLPLFTREEVADMTRVVKSDDGEDAYYLMPFAPKWDGSHLVSTWSHVRDHIFWFPWYNRKAEARRDIDMPSPEAMHDGVMDNFRAADDLRIVVEAAFRYRAHAAVRELRVPATFTAREDSMLYHCLDLLPPLRRDQRIVPLGRDMPAYRETIAHTLRGYAGGAPPRETMPRRSAKKITREFVDRPGGRQILLRHRGTAAPELALVHDGPGSSQALEPLLDRLARQRSVVAPDLPGSGDSTALGHPAPTIDMYADDLAALLAGFRRRRVHLYGQGSGAAVALSLASRRPDRVASLILHDLPLFTAAERRDLRRHLTPPIEPSWDGSHLYRTWLMLRDSHIYWPWYRRTRDAIRRVDFEASPADLQARVMEVLKSRRTYGLTTQAAVRYRPEPDLRRLDVPVLVVAQAGDIAAAAAHRVATLARGQVIEVPRGTAPLAEAIESHLASLRVAQRT
jgi:pimeloyl-ACP methyl ester carboxylesterase